MTVDFSTHADRLAQASDSLVTLTGHVTAILEQARASEEQAEDLAGLLPYLADAQEQAAALSGALAAATLKILAGAAAVAAKGE
jgi:hypothetical protein